jgi:ABC-2 type transport system permease protein
MITPMSIAIETQALTKCFFRDSGWRSSFLRRLDKPAVDLVDLQVKTGELFGLVGPNGAGKTTLIKMLTTLIVPTSGEAIVNGYGLDQELAIKRSVGLVTSDERSFYWRLSGQHNLEFFASLHRLDAEASRTRSAEVLEQVGLAEHADKPFQNYSTGMKQRLSIARALLVQPQILFLDEPTKGLDPSATQQVHELIRNQLTHEQGITVFLTSHNLDEVQRLCDRVAIMNRGKLRACGTLSELQNFLYTRERYQIQVRGWSPQIQETLHQQGFSYQIEISDDARATLNYGPPAEIEEVNQILDIIRQDNAQVEQLTSQQVSLDEIFSKITSNDLISSSAALEFKDSSRPWWHTRQGLMDDLLPGSARQFLRVAKAFLRRDVRTEVSYRISFFLQFLSIFFSVAVFYFVAQLFGESINPYLEPYGGDYFSFVLIGIAFGGYFGVGLSSFSKGLRASQTTGTLEAMLSTPTRISTIILSSAQWNYLMTTLRVLVYLLIGTLFLNVELGQANYLAALVVLVLTIISFSSLGIIAAGFIMVLKRGDPVTWFFGTVSSLLGGIYYPVAVMPDWMQSLAKLIPVTYAIRAMRLALLQGAGIEEIGSDILVLGGFSVLLLPLSLIVFGYAVRLARIDGSLTHY